MAETPLCGWCDSPSVTRVVTIKGKKNRKTAPVCAQHAEKFERAGQMTERLEAHERAQKQRGNTSAAVMRTWGPD